MNNEIEQLIKQALDTTTTPLEAVYLAELIRRDVNEIWKEVIENE